jgi:hypothetical protein
LIGGNNEGAGQGETGHREIVQMNVGQPKLCLVMSARQPVKKTRGSKKRVQGQHWFDHAVKMEGVVV